MPIPPVRGIPSDKSPRCASTCSLKSTDLSPYRIRNNYIGFRAQVLASRHSVSAVVKYQPGKMEFNLQNYKVLSFDIYGTLVDWESAIFQELLPLLHRLPPTHPQRQTSELEQRKFLLGAYNALELEIQRGHPKLPYPDVLAQIYPRLAADLQVPFTSAEVASFGGSVGTWPAFPDTIAAMQTLAKYYKLVVLSNVDGSSFSSTLAGPLQGVTFDAIYTADEIGSYKPDLANFEYLIGHSEKDLGAQKSEILHVAQSLMHDHVPAKAIGMPPGVWIERGGDSGTTMGGNMAKLEQEGKLQLGARFPTLGDLAAKVKKTFEKQ